MDIVCQISKADIPNSFQSHTKKEQYSVCEKRTAPALSRYGQVGLAMYCNTLLNQLGHTERVRVYNSHSASSAWTISHASSTNIASFFYLNFTVSILDWVEVL